MRKLLLIMLVAALSVMSLTACGDAGDEKAKEQTKPEAAQEETSSDEVQETDRALLRKHGLKFGSICVKVLY